MNFIMRSVGLSFENCFIMPSVFESISLNFIPLEALSNIYLTDMHMQKHTPPFKFTIDCQPFSQLLNAKPEDPNDFGEYLEMEEEGQLALEIFVEMGEKYPEVEPVIEVKGRGGMDSEQIYNLEKTIQKRLKEDVGKLVIFDVVEYCRVFWFLIE